MDLDLTLRLGLRSAEVPSNEANNAIGRQGFVSGAAGRSSDMAKLDFQKSISVRQQSLPRPKEMNKFYVFDFSVSKSKVGGSKKKKTTDIERPAPPKTEDVNRICSNFNCKVRETPMWRRGPMGPKTLCNACGIKYRKMKLKEQQGEGSSGEGSSSYQSAERLFYY